MFVYINISEKQIHIHTWERNQNLSQMHMSRHTATFSVLGKTASVLDVKSNASPRILREHRGGSTWRSSTSTHLLHVTASEHLLASGGQARFLRAIHPHTKQSRFPRTLVKVFPKPSLALVFFPHLLFRPRSRLVRCPPDSPAALHFHLPVKHAQSCRDARTVSVG